MREIVRARHVLLEFNGRDVLNISELSVAENERIGLIGASRSGAPRPLQKPHRGFCDTGLRVPDRKTKTAPWGGLCFGATRQSKSEPFLLLIASCNSAKVMVFVPSL